MSSQDNQVQAIIQEIDTLLSQASPRLPWVASHETSQQRQLLERTRQYLVDLQRSQFPLSSASPSAQAGVPAETAQQVLQAVLQEVEYLRTNVMQPLRSEVDDLQRQRQRLLEEMEPSELSAGMMPASAAAAGAIPAARSASEQSIADFLEALINQMQRSLSDQIQQAVGQIQPQLASAPTPLLSASEVDETATLSPEQRLVKLQQLQQRIDQLMQELDATLTTLSASLQHNVESYQASLAEGLDTVQNLGASGEPLINVLVSHLAQQLGRETSAYLQSALPWQPTDADLDNADLGGLTSDVASDIASLDAIATPSTMPLVTEEPLVDLDLSVDAINAVGATGATGATGAAGAIADDSSTDPSATPASVDDDIVVAESVKARALEFLNSLQATDLELGALTNPAMATPIPPNDEDTGGDAVADAAARAASLDLASLDLELPPFQDVSQLASSETNETDAADIPLAQPPAESVSALDTAELVAEADLSLDAVEPEDELAQPEPFTGTDTAPQIQQALGEFYESLLGQNNAPSLEDAISATEYEATDMLLDPVDLDVDLEQAIDDALEQAEQSALEYAQQADVPPPDAVASESTPPAAPSAPEELVPEDLEPIARAVPITEPTPAKLARTEPTPIEPTPAEPTPIEPIAFEPDLTLEEMAQPDQVSDNIEQSTEPEFSLESVLDADEGVELEDVELERAELEDVEVDESAIADSSISSTADFRTESESAIAEDEALIPEVADTSAPETDQSLFAGFDKEDLLAEPAPRSVLQPLDFILDDDTLQILSADLSELEGVEKLEDIDPDAASLADFSADFGETDAAIQTDRPAQRQEQVSRSDLDLDSFDEAASAEETADDTLAEFTADFDDSPFSESKFIEPSDTSSAAAQEPFSPIGEDVTLDGFGADFPTSSADTPTQFEDEATNLADFAEDLGGTTAPPPASRPAADVAELADELAESMEAIIDRLFFNLNQIGESAEDADSSDNEMTLADFGQAIGHEANESELNADADQGNEAVLPDADVNPPLPGLFHEDSGVAPNVVDPDETGESTDESLTNQVLDRLFQENTPLSETDTQTLTIEGAFGAFVVPGTPSAESATANSDAASEPSPELTNDTDELELEASDQEKEPTDDKSADIVEDDSTDLFSGLGTERTGYHRLDELDQHESQINGDIDPLSWQNEGGEPSGDALGLDESSAIAPLTPPDTLEPEADATSTALMTLDEPELEPTAPKPLTLDAQAQDQEWYLGLDIGATGISAVLLNRGTQAQHPLFWTTTEQQSSEQPQRYFRLPCMVQYSAPSSAGESYPDLQPVGFAVEQSGLFRTSSAQTAIAPSDGSGTAPSTLKLHQFKSFLKYGVPYTSPADSEQGQFEATLEPNARWSDEQTLPLAHLQQGLQTLLETLTVQSAEASLCCSAVDLSQHTLYTALRVLTGVIVSYPTNWPDTYSFNIREAILGAQLVEDPAEIFFVDNAIAALLSALPRPNTSHKLDVGVIQAHPQTVRSGNTLILSAGALASEFGLVDLPDPLSELNFEDFDLRSISYGGDAVDQDIVCYLLYPQAMQQLQSDQPLLPPRSGQSQANAEAAVAGETGLSTVTSDWDFQLTYDGDRVTAWQKLGLDQLTLPRQGEPDIQHREQLRQRLQASRLGQSLLQAAQHLKILLQQQAQMTIAIDEIRWVLERHDFERQILLPYVQLLNRHLNTLFSKSGIATEGIRQAICTGGSASFPAIARWLRQKLPNATVIQDTYAPNRPPSCSRIAYGLVNLVYYPQALDIARQQYNDYFLLLEILRSFPQQPLTIHQMMQQLERFGINTQACYFHIMALLEGHLPPGLVPASSAHSPLCTQAAAKARHNSLLVQPLFHKSKGQQYVPNPAQRQRLQQYLDVLLADKHQTLAEPLITQLLID